MPLTIQEFQNLSDEDLRQKYSRSDLRDFARSQLLQLQAPADARSGITAYDPSEDLFSLKNLGTMAGNIPGSAAHMVGDVAEAVTSPIETAKAVWETGAGGLLEGIGRRFGVTYDEEEGLGYDPELLKKTLVEDPAGVALDVAPGGAAVGRVAGLGRIGRAALSPVRAAAEVAGGLGKGTGLGARTIASVMSGIKPGVLTAGREALGQTGEAGKIARKGFEAGKTAEDAIPDAINKIEEIISSELDDVGKGIRSSVLGDQMVSPDAYNAFARNVEKTFKEFNVYPGPKRGMLDFGKSRIPKDVGAQGRIEDALDLIRQARDGYRNIHTGQKTSKGSTLEDYWTARTQISEANSTAFKQKYGDMEQGLLKGLYGNLNELMDSVDNTKFKDLNQKYKEGIELRDRFSKMAGSQMAPEQQISSIIDAVRKGEGTSVKFLKGVQEKTGVPLQAIAAGQDLVGLIPRELVGKGAFMAIVPAVATGVLPAKVMLAMFLSPPRFLRRYLKMIGATERQIKELGTFADKLVGLPRVAAMAEQGLTIGGIINQLSEQAEQPSFLGQLAPASARPMRTGVAEQYR